MAFWRLLQRLLRFFATFSFLSVARLWDLAVYAAGGGVADTGYDAFLSLRGVSLAWLWDLAVYAAGGGVADTGYDAFLSLRGVSLARLRDLAVYTAGGGVADTGYDAFLSLRGVDVRKGFVSYLYEELTRARYNVFLDSQEINIGDDISTTIHQAIKDSCIFIIVFSRNFAESEWCLNEAALIVRRLQRNGTQSERASVIRFKKDKSPGPDGLPVEFFTHFYDLFKSGMLSMVDASSHSGSINSALSASFIALIPKQSKSTSFGEYRPIALCNSLYKIITKIIAERLKKILNSFISKDQHAFLKDRLIMDAVAMAQECLYSIYSKNIDATPYIQRTLTLLL